MRLRRCVALRNSSLDESPGCVALSEPRFEGLSILLRGLDHELPAGLVGAELLAMLVEELSALLCPELVNHACRSPSGQAPEM